MLLHCVAELLHSVTILVVFSISLTAEQDTKAAHRSAIGVSDIIS